MYIGFLIVSPMDKGPSLSRYVRAAVNAVKEHGIDHQVTAMGTIVQSDDIDDLFECARRAVEAVRNEGSERISLSLKVDIRYDKDISIDSKMRSIDGPNP